MNLEICTDCYQNELTGWIDENNYYDLDGENLIYSIRFKERDGLEKSLFDLIERVALCKSPVVKDNEKLKEKVRSLVFSPCREDIEKGIKIYIQNNNTMNIEGYINFRMGEYMDMVDLIVYMVLKSSME